MKTSLSIFLAAFVAMFAYGLLSGHESMKKNGGAEDYLFSRVELRKLGDDLFLVYPDEKDYPLYVYDFKLKAVRPFDASMFIRHPKLPEGKGNRALAMADGIFDAVDSAEPALESSLGLLGLGYSMKDLISIDKEGVRSVFGKEEYVKKFLAALVGGITGYGLGWYVGAYKWMPAPTSARSLKIVSDTLNWQSRKSIIYTNIVLQCRRGIAKIDDDEMRDILRESLKTAITNAVKENAYDYSAYNKLFDVSREVGRSLRGAYTIKPDNWLIDEDLFMLTAPVLLPLLVVPLLAIVCLSFLGLYSLFLMILRRLKGTPSKPIT